jgi:HEPN domain-containing protein
MSSEKLRTEATRYPDGLPDIIPSEAFGKEDSDTAIGIATDILGLVQNILA